MNTPFKSSFGLSLLAAGLLGFAWAAGDGDEIHVRVAASSAVATSSTSQPAGDGRTLRSTATEGWFEFKVRVPVAGRYESVLDVRALGDENRDRVDRGLRRQHGRTHLRHHGTDGAASDPSRRRDLTDRLPAERR